MDIEFDSIVSEYAKKIESMGYTHDESLCLARWVAHVHTINPVIWFDELMDAVEAFGFTPRNKE